MCVSIRKAMRILMIFAVAAAISSVKAAPRKRKANIPPQVPPAQMLRDPAKLDRFLCEAVEGDFSLYYSSNWDVEGQKLWQVECNRLCTQQDGEEYDFYVGLKAVCQSVVSASSEAEAIKRLNALEDFIAAALAAPGSNVRYLFGKRIQHQNEHFKPTDKGRKTTDGILVYMHRKASSIPARRMIEGWLVSRECNYVEKFAEEVVESGFTPGVMLTDGFIKRRDGRYCPHIGKWHNKRYGRTEKIEHEKIIACCGKMSDEIKIIRNAVSKRNAPPDAAKKVIKSSLAELDRQVRQYSAVQGRFLVRILGDAEEFAECEVRFEVDGNYERLLSRLAESLVDPDQKKIVEMRLEEQRRHIASVRDKLKKMDLEALNGR